MSGQLTVRLSEELNESLERAAARMQRTRSEIVRLALGQFLQTGSDAKASTRVAGLLGSLDSGVSDLAERHREYVLESIQRGR